ncbi:FkbM family methyltransferase [Streptomyces sp. NPDC002851]
MTTLLDRMRGAAQRLGDGTVRRAGEPPLVRLLGHHEVDVVLDVGAHTGRYGALLRRAGYTGRIVSFEPLGAARVALYRRVADDPAWTVLPYALGDRNGTVILKLVGDGRQRAEIRRLDGLWESVVAPGERPFLKLDVRGYETRVLDGLGEYEDEVAGLQIETFLEGALLDATLDRVRDGLGFSLMSVVPGRTALDSGRMLQCDLVLFRKEQQEQQEQQERPFPAPGSYAGQS